jgi:hypothetical protein
MTSINVEFSVDIDDVLCEMSTSEKEDLCQDLIEDGHGPGPEDFNGMELDEVLNAETYSEHELVDLFKEMWSSRIHIDHKLVDELRAQLKERNVL